MKKTNTMWWILNFVFPIIFNVVFFVASGFDQKASVWISYGFIHFAYILLLLTPYFIHKGKSAVVFGFSIYAVSATYFLLELVVGVVFMLISPDSYKATLLVQLFFAGLYGIVITSNMIANKHTSDAEEKRQYQIDYIKKASANLKGLLERTTDKEAKKNVERVYDAIYSSPVESHPGLAQMESQILKLINDLTGAVSSGNKEKIISLSGSLLIAVDERNQQLKNLN